VVGAKSTVAPGIIFTAGRHPPLSAVTYRLPPVSGHEGIKLPM